mmetsp:Transcript_24286/g.54018  ORF Transcript_24286/g.54018 Transcript_24286/m.54018 type:complete len:636 (+) Transcript_24286:39-1946(+)
MLTVGEGLLFDVETKGIELKTDAQSQQQVAFNFALRVSLPALLGHLHSLQRDALATQEPAKIQQTAPRSAPAWRHLSAGMPNESSTSCASNPMVVSMSNASAQAAVMSPKPSSEPEQPQVTDFAQHVRAMLSKLGTDSTPTSSWQLPSENDLDIQLLEAISRNSVSEMRQLLQLRANVNYTEPPPNLRTPLHFVLQQGGNVEAVHLLIRARANMNAGMVRGKTPLHYAVQQYQNIHPEVIRMLICSKADFELPDQRGVTPIDTAKMVALQSCHAGPASASRVRQLLNEITEQPTIAFNVVDVGQILGVSFADMHNRKLVFHTEATVGLYSLSHNKTTFVKKLRQLNVQSTVQHVSVNPIVGAIAVCLQVVNGGPSEVRSVQNVCIIWPNGQLQEEEPLKLSVDVDHAKSQDREMPACIILSRNQAPQSLLSRLSDGRVYRWQLNSSRAQFTNETMLMADAGLLAASDDGCWIAAVNMDGEDGRVDIFTFESGSRHQPTPKVLTSLQKRPVNMAIIQAAGSMGAFLALSEGGPPGQPGHVEVLSLQEDGSSASVYRIRLHSPCMSLGFCLQTETHLLNGSDDGVVAVYNLPSGKTSLCHDSPGMKALCISPDRTLIATAEENFFRVFRVPDTEERT